MTPWVRRLLIANVAVFFLQWTLPGLTSLLAFTPALVLSRPWTIVTYMFAHAGLSHIFFNMLGLYFFGPRLESRLGSTHFARLYFISGLGGAVLSVVTPYASIIGASGAIFGVMLAYAMFWPRQQILLWMVIPIEVRWLVLGSTAIAIYFGLGSLTQPGMGGGVAHFAHLGGFFAAWFYLRAIDPAKRVARFRANTVAKTTGDQLSNWKRVDVMKVHEVNRDELNRILDKINARGLASLTPEEKLFLSNFVPPDDRKPIS